MGSPLGWFGNVLLIAGYLLVGGRKRYAFLFTFFGEVVWLVESARRLGADGVVLCGVFALIALINYWRWGKK